MKKIEVGSNEIIHFIGLGGIGMSGLAQIMKISGFKIQGSDLVLNQNVKNCLNIGIKYFKNHKKSNLKNATLVVKSSAIKNNNIEILEAKNRKLPIYDRADMLANIVAMKKNIVVSGSHGKTTTTSLIAKILSQAKLDPTIINGGVINSIKNNAKLGRGEWSVLEADESDGSFLKLPVDYSVITNIDNEHLEFYKNFKNLVECFVKFINKTPPIGKSIICLDDLNIKNILKKIKNKNYITYGFSNDADFQIVNLRKDISFCTFNLKIKKFFKFKKINNIKIALKGDYNVLNSTAAIIICLSIGIKINIIKNALKKFSGVERRMTKIFKKKSIEFYDDYAHHPTEISAVLKSVKDVHASRKIISVFQPHRFSRVNFLKNDFSNAFKLADKVLLCPIYSAGEKRDKNYNHIEFAKLISSNSKVQVIIVNEQSELNKFCKHNLINDEIVIGMGAGTITNWIKNIKKAYARKH